MRDLTQEFLKKAKVRRLTPLVAPFFFCLFLTRPAQRIAGEKGIVLRGHVEVEPSQFQRESEVSETRKTVSFLFSFPLCSDEMLLPRSSGGPWI